MRKAPVFKSYGSVRIAFRRNVIIQKNIWFDTNFGSGSIFSSGEETIFLNEARRKKLKIYEYPSVIAKVNFKDSTWREGYNEKFFYDKGALLARAYPRMKYIIMFYYIRTFRKLTVLSPIEILKSIIQGMKGYRLLKSYNEFIEN